MKKIDQMPPRHPINGTLELTHRCNLKCKMCMFRHQDCDDALLLKNELSTDRWKQLAKEMFDSGVLNILITGGEPLVRKDFCEIYESIYRLGFIITIYTNAIPVTEKILKTFQKYPPHRIGITLYGASNETYETLCGCKDGFDRAIKGARALSSLPSALEFRSTVVKDNKQDIDAISKIVKDEFDLPVIHSTTVFQSVRGGSMPVEQCRLSPKETIDLTIHRSFEKIREMLPKDKQYDIKLRISDVRAECRNETQVYTLLGCNGGMDSFTISWDGKLLGCQMLENFYTDVVENSFQEAWESWPYTVRLPKVNAECSNCPHIAFCQICPGVCQAECGNLSGKPEYICQITKELVSIKERES